MGSWTRAWGHCVESSSSGRISCVRGVDISKKKTQIAQLVKEQVCDYSFINELCGFLFR